MSAQATMWQCARDLLHQGGVGDVVETGAAVLDGDDAAGEAERAGLLDELLREALCLVVLGHARGDLALRPVPRKLDQLALLLVEPELHRCADSTQSANRLVELPRERISLVNAPT